MITAIRDALLYCPNLPTLPSIAIRILEAGRNPDANIGELASLIAKDPALSAKILRVCNSPLYAQRRSTANLHQAVMLLGLNATMTLALSFSLSDMYRTKANSRKVIERVWRRALISALASRLLSMRLRFGSFEELYLAGLLQDLGMLALDASLPERYSALLDRFHAHDHFIEIEREALGTDHGEAGAWLMNHWGLPDPLALTAAAVHDPDGTPLTGDALTFVRCVALAGQLAEFFLTQDLATGLDTVLDSAERWFGLDECGVESLVEEIVAALPEMGSLFEVEILSPRMAAGLIEQSREILATRNLRLIHQTAEHQKKVLEITRETEVLQEAAIHDALTGLHNRRHFDQILQLEFGLANDNGWPLTLGFIDLDHFKQVNDTRGHVTGDTVLTKIAAVIKQNLRERDYIMRYGGEEFVVLLPGQGTEAAIGVFERLRLAIASARHRGESGEIFFITASIGIAAHMDGTTRIADPLNLLRAADRALYDAKRQGRNRIKTAE